MIKKIRGHSEELAVAIFSKSNPEYQVKFIGN